jgi:ESS family glutamate:Na+ symporter
MSFIEGDVFVVSFNATVALMFGVIILYFGIAVNKKVGILRKFCIPPPVTGGLIFSFIHLMLYQAGIVEFRFNETLQLFFMNMFFTTIGFSAGLGLIKKAGKIVFVLFVGFVVLAVGQNLLAAGVSNAMGIHPLLGMMAGSPALAGGHGNAVAFGRIAEEWGHSGAVAFGLAASTYGLIAAVLFSNPAAEWLIKRYKLPTVPAEMKGLELNSKPANTEFNPKALQHAFLLVVLALGIGFLVHWAWGLLVPGFTIVIHVWGLTIGAIFRVVCDARKIKLPEAEIETLGKVFLALFVALAVAAVQLWQLVDLALPLLIILLANTIFTIVFVMVFTFWLCGKNYDAACIVSGQIGFGLGSTITSMVNLDGLSQKYAISKLSYFVIPIVGAFLGNFANAFVINTFMSIFR